MNAIVFGATGLVGKELVKALEKRKEINSIILVSRRKSGIPGKKLREILYDNTEELSKIKIEKADLAFCAVGSTLKKAGSVQKFYEIDHDLCITFAQIAHKSGVQSFVYVSSVGANSKKKNYYLRTKGKTEEDLKTIFGDQLKIVRPSILLGEREEFRLGEAFGKIMMQLISPMLWGQSKKYKAVHAKEVAQAMIQIALSKPKKTIFASHELIELEKDKKNDKT